MPRTELALIQRELAEIRQKLYSLATAVGMTVNETDMKATPLKWPLLADDDELIIENVKGE